MSLRTSTITLGLLVGLSPGVPAATPAPLSGGILGQVRNAAGVAQMGATVILYNRYDQLIRQVLTNEQGKFAFDALSPDLYSIRVTLASFMPAIRRNIAVAAGSENLLQISLASVLSTVELSSAPARGTLMTDDWKWVLRTSQATRPVLRLLPNDPSTSRSRSIAALFSDTTGLVKLSAGDAQSFAGDTQQDLGTAFALATSIMGSTRVQFSGSLGYAANAALPATGFRTSYSRTVEGGTSPEVTLTVRQLYLPARAGSAIASGTNSGPALRTAALGVFDRLDLLDDLHLEYGFNLESVSFIQRLNFASPFARATYDLGEGGAVRFAFSSGTQLNEPVGRGDGRASEGSADLSQELAALALVPRVSLRDGEAHVQRTQNFEAGYERVEGSRTYSAGVYRESASNAAFTMSAPQGFVPPADLLPELGSPSTVFDVGNYQRVGYDAAVKQTLGDRFDVLVAAGRAGALLADSRPALSNDPNELRSLIHQTQRSWITVRVSGTLSASGTHLTGSYGWTDFRALMPAHLFLTQKLTQDTGWNVYLRQPLPMILGLPGRLEATAELRNLLAQGYLTLHQPDRSALLTNSPRAVRGGLSFIF